jgi:hypothetical protein
MLTVPSPPDTLRYTLSMLTDELVLTKEGAREVQFIVRLPNANTGETINIRDKIMTNNMPFIQSPLF